MSLRQGGDAALNLRLGLGHAVSGHGYLAHSPRVEAQAAGFPYGIGDSVELTYGDGITRPCIIEEIYGAFVSCKLDRPPFSQFSPRPYVYNLNTLISAALVARRQR